MRLSTKKVTYISIGEMRLEGPRAMGDSAPIAALSRVLGPIRKQRFFEKDPRNRQVRNAIRHRQLGIRCQLIDCE